MRAWMRRRPSVRSVAEVGTAKASPPNTPKTGSFRLNRRSPLRPARFMPALVWNHVKIVIAEDQTPERLFDSQHHRVGHRDGLLHPYGPLYPFRAEFRHLSMKMPAGSISWGFSQSVMDMSSGEPAAMRPPPKSCRMNIRRWFRRSGTVSRSDPTFTYDGQTLHHEHRAVCR